MSEHNSFIRNIYKKYYKKNYSLSSKNISKIYNNSNNSINIKNKIDKKLEIKYNLYIKGYNTIKMKKSKKIEINSYSLFISPNEIDKNINYATVYYNLNLISICSIFNKVDMLKYIFKYNKEDSNINYLSSGFDKSKGYTEIYTSLMLACIYQNTDIVKELLNNNADVNIEYRNNNKLCSYVQKYSVKTALIYAVIYNNIDILKLLINNDTINLDIKDIHGNTALIYSCSIKDINIDIVKLLIDKNADIYSKNCDNTTALIYTCMFCNQYTNSHIETVKLLINKAKLNKETFIEYLNTQDKDGKTSLMYACQNGSLDIVNLLVDNECYIDIQDIDGETSLMHACKNNYPLIVKKLLEKNPDIYIKDKSGKPARSHIFNFSKNPKNTNNTYYYINKYIKNHPYTPRQI